MIEMLIQIPGPRFLIYFTGLSIICIIIGWYWLNAKESNKYTLPEPTHFDSITIAALRGRWASVIRIAVFSLWNRGLVEINYMASGGWLQKDVIKMKSVEPSREKLNPIEKEIYDFLSKGDMQPYDLFQDSTLRASLEKTLDPIYKELEQQHLLRTESEHTRAWIITIIMGMIIIAVGGTKLWFGFTRGRPIGFLFILLVVSLVVLFMVLKPRSIHTRLGRRYLNDLKKHFDWLKGQFGMGCRIEGIDPALSIAIFGTRILSGSWHYKKFRLAFPGKKTGIGGCGGGCGGGGFGGGGCGGGGSSGCGDGGGGCGGGGCGGGGCGGGGGGCGGCGG